MATGWTDSASFDGQNKYVNELGLGPFLELSLTVFFVFHYTAAFQFFFIDNDICHNYLHTLYVFECL